MRRYGPIAVLPVLPVLPVLLALGSAQALDVALQAPLSVMVGAPGSVTPGADLVATFTLPPQTPADLGLGVYVSDRHGSWFQRPVAMPPGPGRISVRVPLAGSGFLSEPAGSPWTPGTAAIIDKAGLFLWSASASRTVIHFEDLHLETPPPGAVPLSHRFLDLKPPPRTSLTGRRWELSLRPQPFPVNPFDPDEFSLDAVVTTPDGVDQRIPGFYGDPMGRSDRGDREDIGPTGAGAFIVRFRPRQPGAHRIRIEARWRHDAMVGADLPPCMVGGPPWDGYIRADRQDPRFLSRAGAFVWPLGPNLRSVNDTRSVECLHTALTPDRGTFTYDAYLERLAAHGATAIELWMGSWNLALEWRSDWPPYHGLGRYSQENAWKLDHLLDRCAALGMSAVLVIDNHGKASTRCDAQWADNPYNKERGGRCAEAEAVFSDAWAMAGQAKVRRYLVARYADHPALLAWKLWSEVNLTNGVQESVRTWHEQAASHLHGLDTYRHPVTTHWSQDYHVVDRTIAALPQIDLIAIDAYHGPDRFLADLLARSIDDGPRQRGLAQFGKPVIVSEFGAQWNAGEQPQMEAEHATGPWVGLVSGFAACPMLWWFEWIDQGERYSPYQAVARFLAGEDLRGKECMSAALTVTTGPSGALWSRSWVRPGHMLGYILDARWGRTGGEAETHSHAHLTIGTVVAAGALRVEWWDADAGRLLQRADLVHGGGPLVLDPPAFRRHLAFKLLRLPPPPS